MDGVASTFAEPLHELWTRYMSTSQVLEVVVLAAGGGRPMFLLP